METKRVNSFMNGMPLNFFCGRKQNIPILSMPINDRFIASMQKVVTNPDEIAKSSDFRGRLYVAINNYIEQAGSSKKNQFTELFKNNFGISATKEDIIQFTKKSKKIIHNFSKLGVIEQAHNMPENCKRLMAEFTKYICKVKP